MKKLIAFISAFFMFFSCTANAAYTGSEIYNAAERSFEWANENISPLGNTDSVAADYCVMALKRAGKVFDYKKYINITKSKTPQTIQDAQRIIMANTAAGGVFGDKFIAENTYESDFKNTQDIAFAITAIQSGEYKVKSDATDMNNLAVMLLEKQNADGSFDSDVLTTAKSIIALSFFSGNCYVVKGENIGEQYKYDVNAAILRGVNYLQNNKNADFGFGNVINTAFVVMALDSAGVDADNDPGFSNGENSTFSALMNKFGEDGSFAGYQDDTAIALCAMVSHLRAMQGNSPFYALRTEDMPYDPNEYNEDINHSGEGLKIETQDEIEISLFKTKFESNPTETPYEVVSQVPVETEPCITEPKTNKTLPIAVVIIAIVIVATLISCIVVYFAYIRPQKGFHSKKSEDEDEDD